MGQLAEIPQNQLIPAEVSPMTLIERAALDPEYPVEKLAQLFALKLQVEAEEARKAFNQAMAQFKKNPPRINKNIQKKAGNIELHYASLDNVVDTITPALSAVGIRHEWKVKQDNSLIAVTCILSHTDGHREETMISAVADNSGSKNSIQAIASTVTYLQRYTLLAATGMAAAGTDSDGTLPKSGMPEHELVAALDAIGNAAHLTELQGIFAAHYKAAQALDDKDAMRQLIAIKDRRKADLA